eukprot:GGOE01019180.1.p1 GENE.GGOE01019180.1~~GGOE01019180.1.p1  ORF type:complete len:754 (+),score=146.45 GGOE01019180.1:26-2263(+)
MAQPTPQRRTIGDHSLRDASAISPKSPYVSLQVVTPVHGCPAGMDEVTGGCESPCLPCSPSLGFGCLGSPCPLGLPFSPLTYSRPTTPLRPTSPLTSPQTSPKRPVSPLAHARPATPTVLRRPLSPSQSRHSGAAAPAAGYSPAELRVQTIGYGQSIDTPFGSRLLLYADYTASGRLLRNIETFLQQRVMPFYGNTHTLTSTTGLFSTRFREEARQIVAESLNANIRDHGPGGDAIIFTGSGSTAAVNKLVNVLKLQGLIGAGRKCVMFVGPHEHHSNLLPWREVPGLKVVSVAEDAHGRVDVDDLAAKLAAFQDYDQKLGSFAVASNVTGVVAPAEEITRLLHQHGALSFWDYATAASHMRVDMNPGNDISCAKDAIFLSPHKLLGGPGSPGILVVKKTLLEACTKPTQPGGGTVAFVTEDTHQYVYNAEEREESGTPDIMGSIRAGCAFFVRSMIGMDTLERLDDNICALLMQALGSTPNLTILGPQLEAAKRLPVISFMINTPWDKNRYLHHSFVCALLNDIFGIQVRGGCMCAGPNGIRILGVKKETVQEFATELSVNKEEIMKPGYVRLSVPFNATDQELQYIIAAIQEVAAHGWAFLPQYQFVRKSAEWRHASIPHNMAGRRWLWKMLADSTPVKDVALPTDEEFNARLEAQLRECKELFQEVVEGCKFARVSDEQHSDLPAHRLRWFALPSEAVCHALGREPPRSPAQVQPKRYAASAQSHSGSPTPPEVGFVPPPAA